MKYRATIMLLVAGFAHHAQTVLNIHLTDQQQRPVTFAIVKHRGSTHHSDRSGFFRISNYSPGDKIAIRKLGFADTMVSISALPAGDTLEIFIRLRFKPMVLPEVSVSSWQLTEVNPLKADFVLGYELKGQYLVELVSDDHIVVTNTENAETFRSRPIRGATDVIKDHYGDLHVTTARWAYRIYPEGTYLRVDTARVSLSGLNWHLRYCDDAADTSLFIRRYKDYNQTVAFFAVSVLSGNRTRLLKEITDTERKCAVNAFAAETMSFNRYLADLGLSKVTATNRAEILLVREAQRMSDLLEMKYALPSYSVLKLVNDSIYLFAHDIDTMFVYDRGWNLVRGNRINYHHLKIWDKELIVNEEKTRVYAKLLENSKPVIAEVDLRSGDLIPASFTTIGARFPVKMKIKGNVAYFMAKQRNGTGYTVYAQTLQSPR